MLPTISIPSLQLQERALEKYVFELPECEELIKLVCSFQYKKIKKRLKLESFHGLKRMSIKMK